MSRWVVRTLVIVCLVVGSGTLAAGLAQSRSGGYLSTQTESFRTETAVFLTDEIDVGSGRPADPEPDLGELGRIRVRVMDDNPQHTLFVGIGNREAVHSWLAGTAYDEFAGATTAPFRATFTSHRGGTAPSPQTGPQWVAVAEGRGQVVLEWDKTAGPWSLVVMNQDGAPGLDVRADLGFRFSFLIPLGAVLTAAAILAGLTHQRRQVDSKRRHPASPR